MLAFMGFLSAASFLLIAKCCDISGTFNYKKMGEQALGSTFGVVIQGCCLWYTTGSCIAYIVLTGDFLVGKGTGVLSKWASNSALLTNRHFVMVGT